MFSVPSPWLLWTSEGTWGEKKWDDFLGHVFQKILRYLAYVFQPILVWTFLSLSKAIESHSWMGAMAATCQDGSWWWLWGWPVWGLQQAVLLWGAPAIGCFWFLGFGRSAPGHWGLVSWPLLSHFDQDWTNQSAALLQKHWSQAMRKTRILSLGTETSRYFVLFTFLLL